MNFPQPLMLFAVPLITLPIIIHLINQRRYQNMQWGAMQFLLAANRMSRGYARLRQWLILACRTLAIAGLIFAACRPLASGLLGSVESEEGTERFSLDGRQWQNLIDLQSRLAQYLRAISEPEQ